ncbi:MAG: hypothetical protein AAGG51_19620 [Cyanobacteria bacterium P01_G01_bin.54]
MMIQGWVGRWGTLLFIAGAIAACGAMEETTQEIPEKTPEKTVESATETTTPERSEQTLPRPTETDRNLPNAPQTTRPTPNNGPNRLPELSVVKAWKMIDGNGVSLAVPEFYDGGNPSAEYEALVTKLKAIDPKYAERLEAIAATPEVSALLAFDVQDQESEFLTSVNIAHEAIEPEITLEDYVQTASQQLSQAYEIQSQSVIPVGRHQAGQIVGAIQNGNVRFKQLFYLIPYNGKMWIITYSTGAEAFERRLNEFTQSIQTIQFAP